MSGSSIGGVVGGIIGFVASGFNPAGFQWGFMIGSAIGGYVDPVKVEGPRLKDAMQQTSQEGVPIPFGYGTFPTAGNIIWAGKLVEHKKKQRQGKGGGAQTTTYTYTRSYAIGICEGPIAGLLMVKRNGKVVWDARDDVSFTEWMYGGKYTDHQPYLFVLQWRTRAKAYFRRWINKTTVYLGDEEQLPDPTIEADEGVGKVSAFRGLAYIVVKDDDVTELQGAIPQYEFVVSTCGTLVPGSNARPDWFIVANRDGNAERVIKTSPDGVDWTSQPQYAFGSQDVYLTAVDSRVVAWYGPSARYTLDRGATWNTLVPPGGNFTGAASSGSQAIVGRRWYVPRGVAGIAWTESAADSWVLEPPMFSAGIGVVDDWFVAGNLSIVLRGGEGGYISASASGGPWQEPIKVDEAGTSIYCGAADDSVVVIGGGRYRMFWTANGTAFTPCAVPFMGAQDNERVAKIVTTRVAGGRLWVAYLVAGASNGKVIISNDGKSWREPIAGPGFGPADIHAARGRVSIVGTVDGQVRIASTLDGEHWDVLATNVTPSVGTLSALSITAYPEKVVFDGTEIPDAPGYYVDENGNVDGPGLDTITTCHPPLGYIVANLCRRAGLAAQEFDVSALTQPVDGYKIATESGADGMIAALMPAFFFDAAEYDGKLRFLPRGGDATFSLSIDDLAERDEEALTLTRVQEAELLRKVTVGYLDPVTAYTAATQAWERRAATVEAKGESAIEVPIVCSRTTAAQIAEKRGKVAWSETEKLEFALPALKWARLTPGDVGEMYLRDGNVMRIRIASLEEDSGRLLVEAARDRQAAYIGTATGAHPPPPVLIDPPLAGPTQLAVLDIPVQRESDDRLGVYVAAAGYFTSWPGASIGISADNGTTFGEGLQVTQPATMGRTTTALGPWISAEYPSPQTLTVRANDTLESIDSAALQRYSNRIALQLDTGEWEMLQFQTVAANDDGTLTLSGLVRGRYATTPGAASAGARWVLLDDAVLFVPLESHLWNVPLKVKPVTLGTDPDAAQSFDLVVRGRSQREWPPHAVRAVRDESDTVTVTWVGRGRIGAEIVSRHSRYFIGYRVAFSDGVTADTTDTTYARPGTPTGVTVSVAAINSITGVGPFSEAIPA